MNKKELSGVQGAEISTKKAQKRRLSGERLEPQRQVESFLRQGMVHMCER